MHTAKSMLDSPIRLSEATWPEYRARQSLHSLLDRYRLDKPHSRLRLSPSQHAKQVAHGVQHSTGLREERWHQCQILRDIFCRPSQESQEISISGLKADVIEIARQVYERGDFSRLCQLADALEAGACAGNQIPKHFRIPGPHVRGCWALDVILAKNELHQQWLRHACLMPVKDGPNRQNARWLTEAPIRLVHVAPGPRSSRHYGSHHRMRRLMEVLGRVLSGGGVAAADMATHLALA
jgi:hypothetical protein